nr:hypothetical protein [Tanacetum cinerariifolium]
MLNSSTGIFSFQFSSMDGLDAMLENGPWFIRKNPLILKKQNPDVNLLKEDVGNVPIWVKLYGVRVTAFNFHLPTSLRVMCGSKTVSDTILKHDLCDLVIEEVRTAITNDGTGSSKPSKERFQNFANNLGVVGGECFASTHFDK